MKINLIQTIIAIGVSFLIAYGLFSFHQSENKLLLGCGSFLFLAIALVMSVGVSFELPRTTTNVRVVSGIFFTIALGSNIVFAFLKFSVPGYIITNGILLLIFMLIVYSINKAKQ